MGDHVVRLGDCLGPEGLASLPDKSVDHVITDPPYEAEAHTLQRRIGQDKGRAIRHESVDFAAIGEDERRAAAAQMVRVCRGWLIVFCQAEAVSAWRSALQESGARWRRPMVWVKPDAQPCLTGDRPGMGYESMATAWCGAGRSTWNGGGKVGVYVANKVSGYQKNAAWGVRNDHPTQKPIDLMESLVADFTDPGELILDPFAGSGTTGVACKRLGRRFLGWERDPKYHAIAERRIRDAREQFTLPLASGPEPKQATLIAVPAARSSDRAKAPPPPARVAGSAGVGGAQEG